MTQAGIVDGSWKTTAKAREVTTEATPVLHQLSYDLWYFLRYPRLSATLAWRHCNSGKGRNYLRSKFRRGWHRWHFSLIAPVSPDLREKSNNPISAIGDDKDDDFGDAYDDEGICQKLFPIRDDDPGTLFLAFRLEATAFRLCNGFNNC